MSRKPPSRDSIVVAYGKEEVMVADLPPESYFYHAGTVYRKIDDAKEEPYSIAVRIVDKSSGTFRRLGHRNPEVLKHSIRVRAATINSA